APPRSWKRFAYPQPPRRRLHEPRRTTGAAMEESHPSGLARSDAAGLADPQASAVPRLHLRPCGEALRGPWHWRVALAPCPARPPGHGASRSRSRKCPRRPPARWRREPSPATSRGSSWPDRAATCDKEFGCAPVKASAPPVTGALDERFDDQGEEGEQRQERGDAEGADEVVLVVKVFDAQGHGQRQAVDMTRDDRD